MKLAFFSFFIIPLLEAVGWGFTITILCMVVPLLGEGGGGLLLLFCVWLFLWWKRLVGGLLLSFCVWLFLCWERVVGGLLFLGRDRCLRAGWCFLGKQKSVISRGVGGRTQKIKSELFQVGWFSGGLMPSRINQSNIIVSWYHSQAKSNNIQFFLFVFSIKSNAESFNC